MNRHLSQYKVVSMGNRSELTPQLQITSKWANPVHIMLVAVNSAEVKLIVGTIEETGISCTYEVAASEKAYTTLLQSNTYDAVLFNYCPSKNSDYSIDSPLKALELLQQSGQNIPLIVITESLPDQEAVAYLKAGIYDYLLKERLFCLPQILWRSLLQFAQQQTHSLQIAHLQKQVQMQTKLNHLLATIGETQDLDTLLQTTVNLLHDALGVSRCVITQPDSDKRMKIRYISQATIQRESLLDQDCRISKDFYSLLIQGQQLIVSDLNECTSSVAREVAKIDQICSFMLIPLLAQGSYFGAICLYHCKSEHQWTEEEITLVSTVAKHCAIFFAQTQRKLKGFNNKTLGSN